jgi:DNA modification methylase
MRPSGRHNERMRDVAVTTHVVHFSSSADMREVPSATVDLVVTSPPYPMIEMWDPLFSRLNPLIGDALAERDVDKAFDMMHEELDRSWAEVRRVLKDGGMACVVIGDALRTVEGSFQLFSNHSRVMKSFRDLGFAALPSIIWRKETNKPNKYMGSGTLPAGAYVTLEHEFILTFRKGQRRTFEGEGKEIRRRSAFFWEERNRWFSDVWEDLKGIHQNLGRHEPRERSAAFPFELAYRLINMFSVMGDIVLDPFLGTGTTTAAAICSCRSSIGYELEDDFARLIHERIREAVLRSKEVVNGRLFMHRKFIQERASSGKEVRYRSKRYGFPVVTEQETDILLPVAEDYEKVEDGTFRVRYSLP